MKAFQPSKKFKQTYDAMFKEEPEKANLFLLLCELADEKGEIHITDEELQKIMDIRFNDPKEYAFGGNGIYKAPS